MPARVASRAAAEPTTSATAVRKTVASTRSSSTVPPSSDRVTRATRATAASSSSSLSTADQRSAAKPTPAATTSASATKARTTTASRSSASTTAAASKTRATATATASATTRKAPAAKASISAAASSRAASTPASQKARPPREPLDEDGVLNRLKDPAACDSNLILSLLELLGTDGDQLGLSLNISGQGTATPESSTSKLAPARAVYFAKQVVNAVLSSSSELIAQGWKPSSAPTPKTGAQASSAPSSSVSRTGTSRLSAKTSTTSLSAGRAASSSRSVPAAGMAPSPSKQGPSDASVRNLIDSFRIAARFLCQKAPSPAKGKELEVPTVAIRFVHKVASLELNDVAIQDLVYLARTVLGIGIDATDGTRSLEDCILIPFTKQIDDGAGSCEWSGAEREFILELQSHAVYCRIQTLGSEEQDLSHIVGLLCHEKGPIKWQEAESRREAADVKTADRAAYASERAITKYLQRLGSPTGLPSLPLRSAGLQLLVRVTELDADAFWDRAARTGTSCVRTVANDKGDVRAAFAAADNLFQTLVSSAEGLSRDIRSGDGFTKFCENWISLATKVGSTDSIDRATRALDRCSSRLSISQPLSPSPMDLTADGEPELDRSSKDEVQKNADQQPPAAQAVELTESEIARIAASSAKAVVTLDKLIKGEIITAHMLETLNDCASTLKSIFAWPASASQATQLKLYRVLDQIRRRCLKTLDISPKDVAPQCQEATAYIDLITAVLNVLEPALDHLPKCRAKDSSQLPSRSDHVADLVYTLRLLANNRFDMSSSARQVECERYLSRCTQLLQHPVRHSLPPEVCSESIGFVSSSFYNLGGKLYSDRQYDAAVRFLTPACELATESVQIYEQWKQDRKDEDGNSSEWAAKDEQSDKRSETLTRKWEHLAVSCRLGSHRAESMNAYRQAVMTIQRPTLALMESLSLEAGPSTIFQRKELATITSVLRSAIDLSVFDLLESQDPSQSDTCMASWMLNMDKAPKAAGVMLEYCASILEAKAHRDEALDASRCFLDAAVTIYSKNRCAMRQGRALLKRVELELLSGSAALPDDEIRKLIEEARTLFSQIDLPGTGGDAGLVGFLPQYRALLLFLQVELDQRQASTSSSDDIIEHVQEACKELRSMLVTKVVPSPSTKAPTAPRSGRVPASRELRSIPAPPQVKTTEPSTPPRQKRQVAPVTPTASRSRTSRPSTASAPTVGVSQFDNPEQLCQRLEQVHEALATYGLTHASIEVVKILRRVSQSVSDLAVGKEIHIRSSAFLAAQYIQLGRNSRASTVLNQALGSFTKATPGAAMVSDDTKIRCLLVSADLLSRTGHSDKSVQRFEEAMTLAQAEGMGPPPRGSGLQQAMEKCMSMERKSLAWEVHATIQCARGDLAGAVHSAIEAVRLSVRMTSFLGKLTSSPAVCQRKSKNDTTLFSAPPSSDNQPESGPAIGSSAKTVTQPDESPRLLPKLTSAGLAALHWRLTRHLIRSFLRASQLYSIRGCGCDADAFAGESIEVAKALNLSLSLTKALIQRGEVRLQLGQVATGQEDLSQCMALLQERWIPEAIVLSCIQGDSLAKIEQFPEALKAYVAGETTLRTLTAAFSELDAILPSPKPQQVAGPRRSTSNNLTPGSRRSSLSVEGLLPEVQGRLLRRQAWIHQLLGRTDESEDLIERAIAVNGDSQASTDAKVEHQLLQGRVALRRALQQLESDQLLSMLPDAAISVPMVPSTSTKALSMTGSANPASAAAIKSAMSLLTPADAAFREALAQGGASSHALSVREAFISLAQVHTMQATLGKGIREAASTAASLVDSAISVTVRRDLLHAVQQKLRSRDVPIDPNSWPTFNRFESVDDEDADEGTEFLGRKMSRMTLSKAASAHEENVEQQDAGTQRLKGLSDFWEVVRSRHDVSQRATSKADKDLLPGNWTVISMSFLKDRETLLVTRQTGGGGPDECLANDPAIYSLPLDRQSRREGEEGELTLRAAQEKLDEIVRMSNDGVHGAKDVDGMDARKRWWSARRALDKELEELLAAMESTWLGAFKGVFAEPTKDEQALAALRSRFDKIIRRSCFPAASSGKKPSKLKLDDAVFECFAGLPEDCTDEDIEDLLHYVMDALQFSGLQVAVDEVDLDEVALDLRNALEEFRGKQAKNAGVSSSSSPVFNEGFGATSAVAERESDHHIFLILDKDTSMFPWESMPILRGRAVSRIPSMAFLQDRIELAKVYHCLPGEQIGGDSDGGLGKRKSAQAQRASESAQQEQEEAWRSALRSGKLFNLSKRRTFYLLNPGGDLVRSQERFEPWLKGRSSSGWSGIVGREPIVDELPKALERSDLMLYFGHSGAEQYIRQAKIRELERCAVTMLWGCSSAILRNNGDFDRTGTPLNYMCAGSPAMVGNLWDTTDRELDSVCEGVLGKLGLMSERERESGARSGKAQASRKEASRASRDMSIMRAVAESRDECKLPFLTGAACVVYGVPVYWAHDGE